ncbi:uncharacterized protein LOC128998665 [Macrosteles quadrilineatus]|uniref:uncharacterized protein LOC128998665 n=1 Tax=Macrosteles quadrilineatus TaxID=74068 RepID=UPI0023E1725A|nr:uncharacterized protein LOC128998665 [Macrosteles quadrilineatus]
MNANNRPWRPPTPGAWWLDDDDGKCVCLRCLFNTAGTPGINCYRDLPSQLPNAVIRFDYVCEWMANDNHPSCPCTPVLYDYDSDGEREAKYPKYSLEHRVVWDPDGRSERYVKKTKPEGSNPAPNSSTVQQLQFPSNPWNAVLGENNAKPMETDSEMET